jgi:hypothetical protein
VGKTQTKKGGIMPRIGVGIGVDFRKGGGVNWPLYWTTLISATVENAAPTHVVLTFPAAATTVAADITATVNGAARVVSSASWTGSVWTVVLVSAIVYGDVVVMTFVPSGGTANVTNNAMSAGETAIRAGNTVAWYDSYDLTTITKDGGNLVSRWNDKLGGGHDLLQATGTNQPLWVLNDGVLFDGIDNFMVTGNFAFAQPMICYIILKQVTWFNGAYILSGGANLPAIRQLNGSPEIDAVTSQGAVYYPNNNLAVGDYGIVRLFFNGASSKIQVNATAAVTFDSGTDAFAKIHIGSQNPTQYFSNVQFKEIIYRDSTASEADIYNYLASKYSFP